MKINRILNGGRKADARFKEKRKIKLENNRKYGYASYA